MTKKVGFFHSPFAFAGTDNETSFLQAVCDCVEWFWMTVQVVAQTGDIVNANFNVFDVTQCFCHDLLSQGLSLLDLVLI